MYLITLSYNTVRKAKREINCANFPVIPEYLQLIETNHPSFVYKIVIDDSLYHIQ